MAQSTGQYEWIAKVARVALVGSLVALILALAATGALTVNTGMNMQKWTDVAPWILALLVEILLVFGAFLAYGMVKLTVSVEYGASNTSRRISRLETLAADQSESLKKIVDFSSLSDQAKSLLYRDREIEAFREVVHEEIMRQEYDTATSLIDEIEKKLGYADEAHLLRDQIGASRKATLDEKIDAAITRVQQLINQHNWARAIRESQRITRLFPNNPKVSALSERIESARSGHKRSLLQGYGEAVRKNDVDHSIALLKELDLYLTPQEAAALEESARGVFKARLHQLGVQFAIRATDQQWKDAIAVGEGIIREFPNSRMAQEVREKMDLLRSRAEAAAAAPATGQKPA